MDDQTAGETETTTGKAIDLEKYLSGKQTVCASPSVFYSPQSQQEVYSLWKATGDQKANNELELAIHRREEEKERSEERKHSRRKQAKRIQILEHRSDNIYEWRLRGGHDGGEQQVFGGEWTPQPMGAAAGYRLGAWWFISLGFAFWLGHC